MSKYVLIKMNSKTFYLTKNGVFVGLLANQKIRLGRAQVIHVHLFVVSTWFVSFCNRLTFCTIWT